MSYQKIETVKEFISALRSGPYTSVGSYPMFFAIDGDAVSFKTAKADALQICRDLRAGNLREVLFSVNWESDLYCEASGEQIESAYGVAE